MDISHVPAPDASARRVLREAFASRLNAAMVVANALGIGLFLWAASHAWADPVERRQGIPPAAGEAFVWFLYIAPIVAAFLAVNVVWFGITCARRQWHSVLPFVVVIGLWFAALVLDNLQH